MAENLSKVAKDLDGVAKNLKTCIDSLIIVAKEGSSSSSSIKSMSTALLNIQKAMTEELKRQNIQLDIQKKFNNSLVKEYKQELAYENLRAAQLNNENKIIRSSHELEKKNGTILRNKLTYQKYCD